VRGDEKKKRERERESVDERHSLLVFEKMHKSVAPIKIRRIEKRVKRNAMNMHITYEKEGDE
jgi:hypothetical protein